MVLIYSSKQSSRLQYITKLLFTTILQVKSNVTTNKEEFESYDGPKINYSFEDTGGMQILPKSLLFKSGIEEIETDVVWANNTPMLFHQCANILLPFDPFAASFYMVSRYEEYTNKQRDFHGRFLCRFSMAKKHGFAHISVVDRWAIMLKNTILLHYPTYTFPQKKYSFVPTIDVDSIAAYKGKSALRLAGSTLKSILRFDGTDLKFRWDTLVLKKPDPLDTFDLLNQLHEKYNVDPIYFFLVGKHSKFDGNLNPSNPYMQKVIQTISNKHKVGIHPSYFSNLQQETIKTEIEILHSITGEKITASRQHFLRMELPETYRSLINAGIIEDYTMGFADSTGFRAGTCTPFYYYDLEEEKETGLLLYPLHIMDASLQRYMNLSPEEAIDTASKLIQEIKNVNGTFISLWHNSYIYESYKNIEWTNVYPAILKMAKDS